MGTKNDSYEIDITDIYKYERSLLLKDKSSEVLATEIINEIENIIFQEGFASFGMDEFKDGDKKYKEYHSRQKKKYSGFENNIKERYRQEYFFIKDSCFQFNQSIIIKNTNTKFDFWFALKLRQYDSKTLSLIKFLDSQLVISFNNDIKGFVKFLKFGILVDQSEILLKEITDTIDSWINTNDSRQVSNKNTQKMQGEINSFLLNNLDNDSNYFKRNIKNRQEFHKVFSNLKKHKFISSDTKIDNFTAIFSNKQISKKNRITWVGTNKELQWFVKYLNYHSQKIKDLKNDIWFVTIKCFVNDKKEEFSNSQLSDAKGKKLQRKELIEEILSKI